MTSTDRLGDADDRELEVFIQPLRHPEGVVAANRDEGIETQPGERLAQLFDRLGLFVRVGAGRTEDGPPLVEDLISFARLEGNGIPLDGPAPPLQQPKALTAPVGNSADNSADDGIQRGTISPAGQHRDLHDV